MLYDSFHGTEVNGVDLADLCRTVPFFEHTRLVLVWDADKLREADQKEIMRYAEDPAPFTCLVLVAGEDLPKGKLFSFLKGRYPGACLGFPGLKRAQCLRWLENRAREKGLGSQVGPGIIEGLLSGGQVSLEALENQLDILALYVQDQEDSTITESLPFAFPGISLDQFYRLTDPLLRGELPNVLDMLNRFVGQGVPPLMLLARIAWEIRRLWQIKDEMERGPVTDAFLKSIRVQPFKKAEYSSLARRLSWGSLGKLFFALGETDRQLKSSRLDPQLHLEGLCERIVRLVNAGSGASENRSPNQRRH
jgi:DNA polymerase-3 subunit delta